MSKARRAQKAGVRSISQDSHSIEPLEQRLLLARTIYVDAASTSAGPDGSSWSSAYADLQLALAAAVSGDQIHVAQGVYRPTTTLDRTKSFLLKSGVGVFGGYGGSLAADPDERDVLDTPTILSGDIGLSGDQSDNSYHVVRAEVADSSTTLDGFAITSGNANRPGTNQDNNGGGMLIANSSTLTVQNCTFVANSAITGGGLAATGASPTIINCVIVDNQAEDAGGIADLSSNITAINCTIVGNSASSTGGAIVLGWSPLPHLQLFNSVIWGNRAPSLPELRYWPELATLSYCDVEGGYLGTGNVDTNPMFLRMPTPGSDGIWGTVDDDYGDLRLQPFSPLADAGSNALVPSSLSTDRGGGTRFQDIPTTADTGSGSPPVIDIGAFEAVPAITAVIDESFAYVLQGNQITFHGHGSGTAPGPLQFNWEWNGDGKFDDASGPDAIFNSAGQMAGAKTIQLRVTDASGVSQITTGILNVVPAVVYVDGSASGANDGTSWDNAYTDLTTALQNAVTGVTGQQIRVASGVYTPTSGTDRAVSFQLKDGVSILGGYSGTETPDPDLRDPAIYSSILSGDIGVLGDAADNSIHVVTSAKTDGTAILNGMVISGGNANVPDLEFGTWGGGLFNLDGAPTISNCTFSGNTADNGGAIFTYTGTVQIAGSRFLNNSAASGGAIFGNGPISISDSTFSGNAAIKASADNTSFGSGGAVYLISTSALTRCIFGNNRAVLNGGAVATQGTATVVNCLFFANEAIQSGGAVDILLASTFIDCEFVGNHADQNGGAVYGTHPPVLINCTLTQNSATVYGGGVYANDLTATGVIIWANSASSSPQMYKGTGTFAVTYSDIQGGFTGTGNINSDPQFLRNPSPGSDQQWGTGDDDYGDLHLGPFSPALDGANNTVFPANVTTDQGGRPRFVDIPTVTDHGKGTAPIADMGAYEASPVIAASADGPFLILQGTNLALQSRGAGTVAGPLQFAWDFNGDGKFDDATGSNPVFSTAGQPVGTRTIQLRVTDAASKVAFSSTTLTIVPRFVYVDASATGDNNGTSWSDAYTNLATALGAAVAGVTGQQIRVAHGVYVPRASTDRNASFALKNGVLVQGGYAGLGSPTPDLQNPAAYPSILSGDIGVPGSQADNSIHIITATATDTSAILDGFTITGGSGDAGGGLFASSASPTVRNCLFTSNTASDKGGAIANLNSSPVISNCTFTGNQAGTEGGALSNIGSSPTVINCTFTSNTAQNGGAVANGQGSAPTISGCSFLRNTAVSGGAIENYGTGSPKILNCVLAGNSSTANGGAVLNTTSTTAVFSNCLLVGNKAGGFGGAAEGISSATSFINCDIVSNLAQNDGALDLSAASFAIKNCIVFFNSTTSQILQRNVSSVAVTFSDIQGGFVGTSNINADPAFVRNPSPGPDGTWGTADDDYGNLHLRSQSLCIDAGSNAAIVSGTNSDIDGNPRLVDVPGHYDPGAIVDLGAYEAQMLKPTVPGSAGDDSFFVQISPDHAILQIWSSAAPTGAPTYSYALAFLTSGAFSTGTGNDSITMDLSSGSIPFLTITSAGQESLTLSGPGSYSLTADLGQTAPNVTLSLSKGAAVTSVAPQHLVGLNLTDASHLNLNTGRNIPLSLSSLSLDASSKIDLADNNLIVHYGASSPEAMLREYIQNWVLNRPGPMLMASAAGDSSIFFPRTLAVSDNQDLKFKSFSGQTFAAGDFNQILVKYTYFGDANFDGQVTPRDYAIIDGNIGLGHDWGTGDLNGDGKVSPSDYAQIDGNIGAGTGGTAGPQLIVNADRGVASPNELEALPLASPPLAEDASQAVASWPDRSASLFSNHVIQDQSDLLDTGIRDLLL